MARVTISIIADLDMLYIRAAGDTPKDSALAVVEKFKATAFHEDLGSVLASIQISAVLDGEIVLLTEERP